MSAPPFPSGALFLVATPIGNLEDLSARAQVVLAQADLIAAEDTRHTGLLLKRLDITRPLVSLHEHNEQARAARLVSRLADGETIAVVADAGTPLISDPGYELVRAAIAQGITVVAVPGPCAAIVALTVSGLATDRFAFEGFLPSRRQARRARLEQLRSEQRTLVFYEAPHRLAAVLADLGAVFGAERRACVARELTKAFESVYRGGLHELAQAAANDPNMSRGEIVLVIQGAVEQESTAAPDVEQIVGILARELPPAQAAKLASRITGLPRARLYEMATRITRTHGDE